MLGTHWGKRIPFPLLPATFVCFIMLHKVTRDVNIDDNRTPTYYRDTGAYTDYVSTDTV